MHHTNEIAQSEGATGKTFATYWLHGGFLVLGKEKNKMAKSGDFLTLDKVTDRGIDPLSYRLFCLSASYRNELAWSWDALQGAANTLHKLKSAVGEWRKEAAALENAETLSDRAKEHESKFSRAIFSDLNAPKALAALHGVVNATDLTPEEKLTLCEQFDHVLGLGISEWTSEAPEEIPAEVTELLAAREKARAAKDWPEADRLRDELLRAGFQVIDTKDGPSVVSHKG